MEVKNKVVLITGSSLGIGRETAKAFAKEKAKPIITYYKDEKEGKELAEKLGTKAYQLNITSIESISSLLKKVKEDFGDIDILINNAGVIYWKPLKETSFKEIEEQIRVNLEGLIKMTKAVLDNFSPEMIINIASGAGKTGYADLTTYCATKFGVRGFSEALSKEVNIKIRVVNPRSTKTRMTNFKGDPPEKVAGIILKVAKEEINEFEVDVWNYL